ncbi:MAG: metal-dependent transcriptional regulator [Lachnospiraceae bacterium]|nr:metal-dependent transcriptional regulator [Lachnospiraceae bacterium]
MKIQESAEDYLETILILSKRKPQVRSIDIVNEMHFSKPSVSVAMKNLRENGYIHMDNDGFITLEDKGRAIAEMVYDRHTVLSRWLEWLGVDAKTAAEDACRMEHTMSPESFALMRDHILKEIGDQKEA